MSRAILGYTVAVTGGLICGYVLLFPYFIFGVFVFGVIGGLIIVSEDTW